MPVLNEKEQRYYVGGSGNTCHDCVDGICEGIICDTGATSLPPNFGGMGTTNSPTTWSPGDGDSDMVTTSGPTTAGPVVATTIAPTTSAPEVVVTTVAPTCNCNNAVTPPPDGWESRKTYDLLANVPMHADSTAIGIHDGFIHDFVSTTDSNGKTTTYGNFAKWWVRNEDAKGHTLPGTTVLRNYDEIDHSSNNNTYMNVHNDKAAEIEESIKNTEPYNAATNNCVHLANRVAEQAL